MANSINWFEIPATDLQRAKKFYSAVMEIEMPEQEISGMKMAFFPYEEGDVSGALVEGEMFKPSADGAVVYLNCGEDLSPYLSRVETAGGKVVMPRTLVTEEIGSIAMFIDSEGNRIALHSLK